MLNVILFSLISGLFALLGVSFLFRAKKRADKLVTYATPFAAGVLLGASFTDLLPEALHSNNTSRSILTATLLGILVFFMLERFLHWFHHHHEHNQEKATTSLIIIGDTLHNALDGIALGAAFLVSAPTGIIAALAIAAHEVPQEIGDFGLLLRNGMKYKKAVIVNIISALATTVTAVITYGLGSGGDGGVVPFLLAATAGFFIYIATSDVIPEIHEKIQKDKIDIRPWLLLLGAGMIMIISPIAHKFIEVEESNNQSYIDGSYHE